MGRKVRRHTFSSMSPKKTQISLRNRAVWSDSSLSARRNFASLAFQNAPSEDSDQTARMRRLIWIFAGRTCPKLHIPDVASHYSDWMTNSADLEQTARFSNTQQVKMDALSMHVSSEKGSIIYSREQILSLYTRPLSVMQDGKWEVTKVWHQIRGFASSKPNSAVLAIDHEIISTVILPMPRFQDRLWLVAGKSICTKYWLTAYS